MYMYTLDLRVSSGWDKVETHVDTSIMAVDQISLNLELFLKETFELHVEVVGDGIATVLLVDLISKTSCTGYSQA